MGLGDVKPTVRNLSRVFSHRPRSLKATAGALCSFDKISPSSSLPAWLGTLRLFHSSALPPDIRESLHAKCFWARMTLAADSADLARDSANSGRAELTENRAKTDGVFATNAARLPRFPLKNRPGRRIRQPRPAPRLERSRDRIPEVTG